MTDYRSMQLGELRGLIVAECEQHVPLLADASAMWEAIRPWLALQADKLDQMRRNLRSNWKDFAGSVFDAEALKVAQVAFSWTDKMAGGPESGGPLTTSTTTSQIKEAIDKLIDEIHRARDFADGKIASLAPDASKDDVDRARNEVADKLDGLAPFYQRAASQLLAAPGRLLTGEDPKAALPSLSDQPGPGVPNNGGGGDPAANPEESPAPQDVPDPEDPAKDPAENSPESPVVTAKNAVDVASKLLDLAKNAGGGGGNPAQVPNPLSTAFDPADLYQPADLSSVPQPDSGLPGLAGAVGGGAGTGAGGGGIGPAGAAAGGGGTVSPLGAQSGLSAGAAPAGTATAAGAGTTGSSGMPPMYPPQSGAGRGSSGSGGIRPGAAEHVNAVRSRKTDGKTGVVLAGRETEGKRRRKPAPAKAPKKPPPPVERAEPVEVLDEELWQVGGAGPERSYRT
ncbi:hypothetical protein [Amycolatopsis sp. NPDC054798]